MSERLSADVAIIGGGTAGCSAALHLRRRGASVVLLEARQCGSQASGVNFGGVRQQGRDWRELPLSQRSRLMWDRLPDLVGHDCEFVASGHLKLARSAADMTVLEDWAVGARASGIGVELFGRNAVRDRFPWLGDEVAGASLVASDGYANPRLVAPHFARAARAAGAEIREGAKVVGATRDGGGFRLETSDGIDVAARALVNVAGAWGSEIAARFGEDVPEGVLSPNMIVSEPVPRVVTHSLGVVGGNLYLRQIDRGNVIFGGGRGLPDLAAVRSRPSPASTQAALALAVAAVPALRQAQVIRTWTGLEGYMPDDIPVLGASRTTPGLVHGFGFSGHGFQLGPAVGAVLAELVLDGRTPTDIAPFAIERFAAPV
ncbi:MAG: FAD-binding oxidoreductase [Alphaproteobacteria bacterium]|nr:FAD-binding oxidoreductase [Alphaproteobacteria bacterium]